MGPVMEPLGIRSAGLLQFSARFTFYLEGNYNGSQGQKTDSGPGPIEKSNGICKRQRRHSLRVITFKEGKVILDTY